MSEDFYDVLGVSRDASEQDIKNAYRKKAAQYHPDVSDEDDAEEKFKKVQKAKEVLTDDEKRQMYDQMGHERFQQAQKHGATGGGRGGGNPFGGGGNPFGGGGGFEDLFNNLFNGGAGGQQRNRPRQGRDVSQHIYIDLEDAYHGIERDVKIRRREECPECDGKGHPEDADVNTCSDCNGSGAQTSVQQTPFGRIQQQTTCRTCSGEGETYSENCSECGGSGRVRRTREVTITIPEGFRDGQRLRYRGEGEPGENGGPNGDLFVEVSVREHEDFEREGDDLFYTHPISFPQAVFGAKIDVPTIDGEEELEIPAGTQSGSTFTLSGAGMPHLNGRGSGKLHVEVHVVTPENLNKEQREALKDFAEAGGEEIKESFLQKLKNSL
ncbi:molecular chaperone DnaJ [Haloferax sp. DFSO60]|uniref:molecular chaperone DnaJ n=1 Tax=Haloferax sp. DFSO60 TaxID=3388652 RepID=UPI00397B9D44